MGHSGSFSGFAWDDFHSSSHVAATPALEVQDGGRHVWSLCCLSAGGPLGSPPWGLSSSGRLDWTLHCSGTQSSSRTSGEAARLLRPRLWNLQDITVPLVPSAEQGARPRMWTVGGAIHYFNILPQLLASPTPEFGMILANLFCGKWIPSLSFLPVFFMDFQE